MAYDLGDLGSTQANKVSSELVAADQLQLILREGEYPVWANAMDLSARANAGELAIKIPSTAEYAVGDRPGSGSTALLAVVDRTFGLDTLNVNQDKRVYDHVYAADQEKSQIDLKDVFITEAPGLIMEFLEGFIINDLMDPTGLTDGTNVLQIAASGSTHLAADYRVADVAKARTVLSKARVPKNGRFKIVTPDILEALTSQAELQRVDYSNDATPLMLGVIGRLKGFNIIESTYLEGTTRGDANTSVGYHESALYKAMLYMPTYSEDNQPERGRTFIALDFKFGTKTITTRALRVLVNSTGNKPSS